jgi:hypothetical protein
MVQKVPSIYQFTFHGQSLQNIYGEVTPTDHFHNVLRLYITYGFSKGKNQSIYYAATNTAIKVL